LFFDFLRWFRSGENYEGQENGREREREEKKKKVKKSEENGIERKKVVKF
jgi:hypothetical protein